MFIFASVKLVHSEKAPLQSIISNDYYENHKLFWALDTIGFGKSKPKAFAGNNRLYYFPRFMNSRCLEIIDWSGAFSECTNLTEN